MHVVKKDFKNKVLTGKIVTIEDKTTASGYYLVTARVRVDDVKLWICLFWNEKANDFMKRFQIGNKIYLEGILKDENSISVKFFEGDGKDIFNRKITPQDKQEYLEYIEQFGMVLVPVTTALGSTKTISKHKSDCVKVNGKWEWNIEYAIRTLGAEEVNNQLRGFKKDSVERCIDINPKQFKETIDFMMNYCAKKNGDYLEET